MKSVNFTAMKAIDVPLGAAFVTKDDLLCFRILSSAGTPTTRQDANGERFILAIVTESMRLYHYVSVDEEVFV